MPTVEGNTPAQYRNPGFFPSTRSQSNASSDGSSSIDGGTSRLDFVAEQLGRFTVTPALEDEAMGARSLSPPPANWVRRRSRSAGAEAEEIRKGSGLLPPYQQLLWVMDNDVKWKTERNLGRLVGMYKLCGDIGAGNFAKVKLGIHQLIKEKVAIKIIDKSGIEAKMEKMLSREVACMEVLSHPNLIRLFEVIETGGKVYLISEWAPAGDLYSKVTLRGKLTETEAKPIFKQVLAAVTYMHVNGIIHRDLKAENVFFSTGTTVKVGDFGFSTQSRKSQMLTTFCGSPPYAAPELFRDESYEGAPVDVWALGVLLYFMVEGTLPFLGVSIPALKKAILEGHFTMSPTLSQECIELVACILRQSPHRRLTLSQVIRHAWLKPGSRKSKSSQGKGMERQDTTHLLMTSRSRNQVITVNTIPTEEQVNFGLLSSHETEALRLLQVMGIESWVTDSHRLRGVKSHVVGIYRILLHKLQEGKVWSSKDFTVSALYATGSGVKNQRPLLKAASNPSSDNAGRIGTSKSAACVIL